VRGDRQARLLSRGLEPREVSLSREGEQAVLHARAGVELWAGVKPRGK